MTDAFEKIVIITDRDDRAEDEICTSLLEDTSHFFQNIKNRQWCKNTYQNDFKMQKELQLLLLVIPTEHAGALENVMLDAIAEDAYDKNIVDKTDIIQEDSDPITITQSGIVIATPENLRSVAENIHLVQCLSDLVEFNKRIKL